MFFGFETRPEAAIIHTGPHLSEQSLDNSFLNILNESNSPGPKTGLRPKKVTPFSQQSAYSTKLILFTGWNKVLNALIPSDFVLDSCVQPAFLWLDKPPNSQPF